MSAHPYLEALVEHAQVSGGYRTRLLSGDEMLLASLELADIEGKTAASEAGASPAEAEPG